MSFGKLYGLPENGRTLSILVAAKHNDLDIELVQTQPNASANSSAEYRKVQPLGKIPAFEGANGFNLSEVIAIAIYEREDHPPWQDQAGLRFHRPLDVLRQRRGPPPRLAAWYRPLMGFEGYNKKVVDEASKAAHNTLAVFENHLTENTYLVGERITLADLFTAALLTRAFATVLDKKYREENVAFTRWYNTIINQAAFKAVFPEPKFAEECIKYTPPKKEEKPKPAAAAEEDKPAEAPKAKHPLEALGKPTLALDEWKRQYSNNDTREVAMPWFWQNFNSEEYSLWKVDYKYNNELKLTFMANNLIGGFQARLEASRKYLFGCQGVYGVNYACVVKGVYMVRGQEWEPAFTVGPDWEGYEYTKLDPTSEADRKYVEDIWAWDAPVVVDGKTLEMADGHVFK
ncbi:hypothetical protein N7513_004581 [Penicillium frequentans]|nr:hypothetical protein N7513_004581 [Penicillium glabrum]